MLREIADSHGVSPTTTENGTTVVTTPGGASYAFYEHSTSGRVPTVMTQVEITLPAGAKGRPDVHLKLRFPVREVK